MFTPRAVLLFSLLTYSVLVICFHDTRSVYSIFSSRRRLHDNFPNSYAPFKPPFSKNVVSKQKESCKHKLSIYNQVSTSADCGITLKTIRRHEVEKKVMHIEVYEKRWWLPLQFIFSIPFVVRKFLFSKAPLRLQKIFLPVAKCGIRDFVIAPTGSMLESITQHFPRKQGLGIAREEVEDKEEKVGFMIYMFGMFCRNDIFPFPFVILTDLSFFSLFSALMS